MEVAGRPECLSLARPGQMRLWAMQSIAHGADYISFFRWRTCSVWEQKSIGTVFLTGIIGTRAGCRNSEKFIRRRKSSLLQQAPLSAKMAPCLSLCHRGGTGGGYFHGPLDSVSVMNWFAPLPDSPCADGPAISEDQLTLEQLLPYELLILPYFLFFPIWSVMYRRNIWSREEKSSSASGRHRTNMAAVRCARLGWGRIADRRHGEGVTLVPEGGGGTASYAGKSLPMPLLNEVLEASGGEVLAVYEGGVLCWAACCTLQACRAGRSGLRGLGFLEELAAALLCRVGLEEPTLLNWSCRRKWSWPYGSRETKSIVSC